jgi:hypothetical protein
MRFIAALPTLPEKKEKEEGGKPRGQGDDPCMSMPRMYRINLPSLDLLIPVSTCPSSYPAFIHLRNHCIFRTSCTFRTAHRR